ncbi:peptidase S7 [Calderihabitans maritimus]|uniref:Peptidase S7, Flavivirus NS3 serine protease n=1 Tax=Calderihabitans maritimus TaxID=1246530 RepID=A0A1Z5HNF1_9FIRM|nr:peptidase S7 [Calderihabitans maritimus]GAW91046.1 peptidase S7, Flavivirus NS3 serine protease [Calderihabitans maritimus]
MRIKGIAGYIVDALVERTNQLGQGRNAGAIGLVNEDGYIDRCTELVDGGLTGIPLRMLLDQVTSMKNRPIIEGLEQLPANAVFLMTRPGKTGLITEVSGIDLFNLPIVNIGVKEEGMAGIGIIYPRAEFFDLATEAEQIGLSTLASKTMEEEKEVLRRSNELNLRFLEVGEKLPVVNLQQQSFYQNGGTGGEWSLPRLEIKNVDRKLAEKLVENSMEVGQGREVAVIGKVDEYGRVLSQGKMVAGGIGYVPSRLLASSAVDISGKSLREIYSRLIDPKAVIVHTHPGGTGIMHIGDANAGPGTWGRPIIAIGHDQKGEITGASVIESSDRLFALADEDELLSLKFFDARTPQEEAEIRNRKFGIAQEYTDLCKPIEIG